MTVAVHALPFDISQLASLVPTLQALSQNAADALLLLTTGIEQTRNSHEQELNAQKASQIANVTDSAIQTAGALTSSILNSVNLATSPNKPSPQDIASQVTSSVNALIPSVSSLAESSATLAKAPSSVADGIGVGSTIAKAAVSALDVIVGRVGSSKVGCWLDSFGRGAGSIPKACPASHPEKQLGLCYRTCSDGKGILTRGYKGISSSDRGIGLLPVCGTNMDLSGRLCYPNCPAAFDGRGPVCQQVVCPASYPFRCGALCMIESGACTNLVLNEASQGFAAILNAVANPISLVPEVVSTISLLASFPKCPRS